MQVKQICFKKCSISIKAYLRVLLKSLKGLLEKCYSTCLRSMSWCSPVEIFKGYSQLSYSDSLRELFFYLTGKNQDKTNTRWHGVPSPFPAVK